MELDLLKDPLQIQIPGQKGREPSMDFGVEVALGSLGSWVERRLKGSRQ